MAPVGDPALSAALKRPERSGNVGLLLLLTAVLVGAATGLTFLQGEQAQPIIIGLLALLAMAGVFFVFAAAIGAVRFAGREARDDVTRVMADTAADGILVMEDDGRIVYANESYVAMAGGEGGELRGVERLFSGPAEVSEAIYRLAQAGREHRAAVEEIRLAPALGRNQGHGWYRIRVRPLPRPGAADATLWSIAEVTRDRERQENVFQELQHAIDYLDHAPAGFFSIDAAGRIVYMNATLAGWLGHDLALVGSGGLALADVMPANGVALLTAITGQPGETLTEKIDLDLRRRTGQSLPARIYHRVALGQDGGFEASCSLVLNRSPGEDLGEGQRAAEVRFSRLFHTTPLAIATLTRNGGLVSWNGSLIRLFAIPSPSGTGAAAGSIMQAVAEADRPRFEVAFKAAAEGRGDGQPLEISLAAPTARSARIWLSPVSDVEDEQESVILYALETTEQRQLEQQFTQAQKMNAIGQLAGGVAHDFNNVLQAIIGYSDLLLNNLRPTDPAFQDIMQIKQNANRAASLVRQLLAFSRRQTLRPEVMHLSDALSDLSLLLKRLLGERVELDFKHGRDLWPVKADVNQLEQVIVNLAVNARDAMPEGGLLTIATANVPEDEARRLDRAGMPPADYVLVAVTDTGTGIPPEVLDQIFEPFFTTKEIGKGTGLGLSTVFGIVKQSGGYIYVDSVVGQGTTFAIYLPRHVQSAEEAAEEKKEEAAAKKPAADMTGQGTILLVEDEDAVRAVNARALTARGYTVLEASSGFEALEIVDGMDGDPIDLVISDVVMPEMDGPTLLGELRRRRQHLKVVFVSGYAEDAFRKNLPDGEEFSFLAKPFSLKQLVETAKQAIQRA